MQVIINSVVWEAGEVTINYDQRSDLKDIAGTPVLKLSQLTVPIGHPSYVDELVDLRESAKAVLVDVLEDYDEAEVYVEPVEEGDDDDDD